MAGSYDYYVDRFRELIIQEIERLTNNNYKTGGIVSTSSITRMVQKPKRNLETSQKIKVFRFRDNIINAKMIEV